MSPPAPSDAEDVCLALSGDREAFGRLFDKHSRTVRAIVAAISRDFGSVDDMTQEVFLRGYSRLASLKNPASFGPWLQGIARLVGRERRRQLSRDRHDFTTHCDVATDDGVVSAMEYDEEHLRVLAAVSELPERERLVLHAYYFHDQNVDDVAAGFGISRSGFYSTLERGMNRLRKWLGAASPLSPKTRTQR